MNFSDVEELDVGSAANGIIRCKEASQDSYIGLLNNNGQY